MGLVVAATSGFEASMVPGVFTLLGVEIRYAVIIACASWF